MTARALVLGLSIGVALASGCSGASPAPAPLVVEDGCQLLLATTSREAASPASCLVPFPSDAYRVPDGAMATGFRVAVRGAAQPRTNAGALADPSAGYAADGFSILSSVVATLPGPLVRDGLPSVTSEVSASTRPDGPTLLVDAETGALVPHYVDVFDRGPDEAPRPLVLRALAPLAPRRRYVVALVGVRVEGGEVASPGEGFRRLRDREDDPALAALAPRFETDVFLPLARAGAARERLQLAWDFTTGSAEQPTRDMLRVRDLTLAWLAANTPAVRVTKVEEGTGDRWKLVRGDVTVPLFTNVPETGATLVRGPDGLPVQNGTTTVDFTISIPASVRDRAAPGRAIAYGHGFFGSRAELEGREARTVSDTLGAVTFGIDWWGMSSPDLDGVVKNASGDVARVPEFAERVHQAMANWLVFTAAIKGPLAKAPELQRTTGELVYDPSFVGYFGPSLAHILGGTLAALSPDFSRVVLCSGGAAFTHMMPRSASFGPFNLIVGAAIEDPVVVQAVLAMLQAPLDRIDPGIYARLATTEPLPGSPADRRILMQVGLGDGAVPNVAAFFHARALGLRQTLPSTLRVPGLDEATGEGGSAITLFDFGLDTSAAVEPFPLPPSDVHDGLRVTPSVLRQTDAFLRPGGVVVHPCDGPCDPG